MQLAGVHECTGCGACASVCNRGCISMHIGEEGFFVPEINFLNCIECGACSKSCHILNSPKTQQFSKTYYCGWDQSDNKRHEGSSGGLFGALADSFVAQGGVVYGAALSSDKKTLSHRSTIEVPLSELKKSKYLESDMGITIRRIRTVLKEGKQVLFCGTPCQVYGVRKVLGYSSKNLVLCDFICHGVPSQLRYKQYLCELEAMFDSPVKNVAFRSKKYGWKTYCIVIDFENGKQYAKLAKEDPYYSDFFANINLRSSCYSCNRNIDSAADITLGDFWNARKKGYLDNDKGISLIICNTERGKGIINKLSHINLKELNDSDVSSLIFAHNTAIRTTPLSQPFFSNYHIKLKDRITCFMLKQGVLRNIIYKII